MPLRRPRRKPLPRQLKPLRPQLNPLRPKPRPLRRVRRPLRKGVSDFIAAIGLVLVVEGLVYGGFPSLAKRLATEVLATPEQTLRIAGLLAIAGGVGIVWLVRG